MQKFNTLRVLSIIAFIGLAGFSCFWTAESLYIWQPNITLVGAWLIAVVFYIMASLSFTKFVDSFKRDGDYYGKFGGQAGQILLGFIGLIVFWIIVSLPTNTHTLLYRASIKDVIRTDLTKTENYLQRLTDSNLEIKKIENKYNSQKEAVDAHIARLIAEIDNPSAVGIGERFEKVLVELDKTLGTTIQREAKVGTTRTQWLTTINYYQKQAYAQLRLFRSKCDKEIEEIRRTMGSKELDALIKNCGIALKDIQAMDGVNNEIVKLAMNDLDAGYSFIAANSKYIDFDDNDKEQYTKEGAVSNARGLLSVTKVWSDFMTTKKYDGHGFVYWILIALLVDISAFIFFVMAFDDKKNNAI